MENYHSLVLDQGQQLGLAGRQARVLLVNLKHWHRIDLEGSGSLRRGPAHHGQEGGDGARAGGGADLVGRGPTPGVELDVRGEDEVCGDCLPGDVPADGHQGRVGRTACNNDGQLTVYCRPETCRSSN